MDVKKIITQTEKNMNKRNKVSLYADHYCNILQFALGFA